MFEYGNLRYIENTGWVFISDNSREKIDKDGFIEVFNEIGIEGWELITFQNDVGYLFKREAD